MDGDAGEGRGNPRGWWNAAEAAESPGQSKTYVGLEDSLALDNVLFVPELITGKATQFTRPFFLVAITYMAVESRRVDFDG